MPCDRTQSEDLQGNYWATSIRYLATFKLQFWDLQESWQLHQVLSRPYLLLDLARSLSWCFPLQGCHPYKQDVLFCWALWIPPFKILINLLRTEGCTGTSLNKELLSHLHTWIKNNRAQSCNTNPILLLADLWGCRFPCAITLAYVATFVLYGWSWHIHHDYCVKYLLKLQCSLLFLLTQCRHQGIKPHLHSTKAWWGKKNIYICKQQTRKGDSKSTLGFLDPLVSPKHRPAFSHYLGCIFFSEPLKLKLWTPGHWFSVQKSSGKKERKAGISWEDGLPRRWQGFYSICEKHHTVISVLPQMLWLRPWNWWVMAREYFFASTKMKIIPFHLSLEQPSRKQEGERKKPVSAYGSETNEIL